MVISYLPIRRDVSIAVSRGMYLNAFRRMKVKRPGRSIQIMAAKVAQRAAAERPEIPPRYGNILLAAGHIRRGAQPQIPSYLLFINRWSRRQPLQSRVPARGGYPGMRLFYFSDRTVTQIFHRLPYSISAMERIPHLSRQAGFQCNLPDFPRLPDVMRQRLLTVYVFACP